MIMLDKFKITFCDLILKTHFYFHISVIFSFRFPIQRQYFTRPDEVYSRICLLTCHDYVDPVFVH